MPGSSKAGGGNLPLDQRVTHSHNAHVAVAEQGPRAHFQTDGFVHHASLQIDRTLAQRPAVLVQLVQEVQSNAGGFTGDPRQEAGPEVLDEALTGPQRERPVELPEIELAGWPQGRFGVMDELADGIAKLERPG